MMINNDSSRCFSKKNWQSTTTKAEKNMNENVINEKTTKEIQIEKHDNNDVYQTKKTLVFF